MMKNILMTMAAASAVVVAAPAAAQYANSVFDARINELQMHLQAGVQSGRIIRNEALPLRDQLRQLGQLERQYSFNGLTRGERDQLQMRIQTLRQQIRFAERNGDNRPRFDRDDDRFDRDCPPGLAKKNNGCLPPGQVGRVGGRFDNAWGRVPSQWMGQYRDSDRFTYRYDGRRVYQIDRRTGTIVQVFNRR